MLKPLVLIVLISVVSGCSNAPFRVAVPEVDQETVLIEGIREPIRFWGDAEPRQLDAILATKNAQMKAHNRDLSSTSYLALSGGGENGAFGAGLLSGWSARGDRPEFDIVTGISTGALIAPFAFLGSDYDQQLETFYTTLSTDDLIITNFWRRVQALTGSSALTETTPLNNIITQFISPAIFEKIAAEHRKGRRLYIGTTNLDAQRPVIWDIGALANSSNANALEIFRDILRASSSIPGVMPPVTFNVQLGSNTYQELHVDGGVTSQVFICPTELDLSKTATRLPANRKLYIIRNSKVKPEYQAVASHTLSVSRRSISTLIKSQGIGDLYKMKLIADRDQLDYHLAFVGPEFVHEAKEPFDSDYMGALFKRGFEKALDGYPWQENPAID